MKNLALAMNIYVQNRFLVPKKISTKIFQFRQNPSIFYENLSTNIFRSQQILWSFLKNRLCTRIYVSTIYHFLQTVFNFLRFCTFRENILFSATFLYFQQTVSFRTFRSKPKPVVYKKNVILDANIFRCSRKNRQFLTKIFHFNEIYSLRKYSILTKTIFYENIPFPMKMFNFLQTFSNSIKNLTVYSKIKTKCLIHDYELCIYSLRSSFLPSTRRNRKRLNVLFSNHKIPKSPMLPGSDKSDQMP